MKSMAPWFTPTPAVAGPSDQASHAKVSMHMCTHRKAYTLACSETRQRARKPARTHLREDEVLFPLFAVPLAL